MSARPSTDGGHMTEKSDLGGRRAPAGSGWGPRPTRGASGSPTTRSRCRGALPDEVSACGYEWIELGPTATCPPIPPGSPTNSVRAAKVSAGTVFEHLAPTRLVGRGVGPGQGRRRAHEGDRRHPRGRHPGMFRDEKTGTSSPGDSPRRPGRRRRPASNDSAGPCRRSTGCRSRTTCTRRASRVPGRHRTVPRRHRSRVRAALPGHRARQLLPRGQPAPHPHLPGADRVPAPSRSTPRSSTACSPRTSSGPRRCGWGR